MTHTRARPKQKLDAPALRRRGGRREAPAGASGWRWLARPACRTSGCSSAPAPTSARTRRRRSSCCAASTSCTSSGCPILLAVSRKDFVGALTGRGRRASGWPARSPPSRTASTAARTCCACTTSPPRATSSPCGRALRGRRGGAGRPAAGRRAAPRAGPQEEDARRQRRKQRHEHGRHLPHRPHLRPALRLAALPGRPARARDRGDQRAAPGRDGDQRRPHRRRVQGRVPGGARVRRPARVRGADRRARQPRLAQRRLRPLRGAVRAARTPSCTRDGVSIVAEDSSEPDLNHGQIGRNRYEHHRAALLARRRTCASSCCTTTCCPIPGTGRERNIVYDAGDLLEVLLRSRVNLVLAGHKHVPYAWRLEDLFVVTTGTVSTLRLRGHTRPCYNVIEIDPRARARSCAGTRSTGRSRSSCSRARRRTTTARRTCSSSRADPVGRRMSGAGAMRGHRARRRRAPPAGRARCA